MSTVARAARHPAADDGTASLLRTVLRIDSWGTAVFGVGLIATSGWLSGPLGLPTAWSIPFGVALLGEAAALGLIAGYPRIPARLATTVIVGNALFAVALLLLAFANVIPLTGLGTAFMIVGALLVAIFAELEFIGFRRSRNATERGDTA